MFRNLLIADSGKGHVEEMIRMLQDIPSLKVAKINLLHVVSEQSKSQSDGHRDEAENLLNSAITRMGLSPIKREHLDSRGRHQADRAQGCR